ncbi:right-handed parallel beta-helix repeat-containing protein [bacterium]|nr:right-handed parallel beta-helix repeat-containing protein [bacterium]
MRRTVFMVFAVLLFFLAPAIEAATPTNSLVNFYVSVSGWDSHDGLTEATAFGSVTRAVQALDALESAANTANARVLLSPGVHQSGQIVLSYKNLSYVELRGDATAMFFTSMLPANVIIRNTDLNLADDLISAINCTTTIVFQELGMQTNNMNNFTTMVDIDNCNPVYFIKVKMDYTMMSAGSTLESIVRIFNSHNVTWNDCDVYFDDQTGLNTGVVRNIRLEQSQDVLFENCVFTAWHPSTPPTATPTPQPLVYATQTNQAVFERCGLYQTDHDALTYGFELAPDSSDITIDSCGLSGTAIGIYLDNNWNTVIQNSWFVLNVTAIELNDARNAMIVNNCIKGNREVGIKIHEECIETVIFNNLIVDNGGVGGPQITYDFTPLFPSGSPPPWQSGYNFIYPRPGQLFAKYVPELAIDEDIPNMKEWNSRTGQDSLGESKCYPITFTTDPFIPDSGTVSWEGFGTMMYENHNAPASDYNGQPRPYTGNLYPDTGCFETGDAGLWHHINLVPNTTVETEGNTINVTVHLRNSQNQPVAAIPTQHLYFYLEDTNYNSAIEPTGVIDSPDYPMQVTGTAGLYFIDNSIFFGAIQNFRITVSRSSLDGRTYPFYLRVVEWGDWYDSTGIVYGGRSDDASGQMRWTATPLAQSSLMTATSPVLASGQPQDYSLIRITMRETDGTLIFGMTVDQFIFTGSGGQYDIDLSTFQEDSFNPGTYQVELRSTEVGTRVITATAAAVIFNTVFVEFQSGIYGDVFAEDTTQPLPDIRLQLRRQNGDLIGETYSDINGNYRILVPIPQDEAYTLSAVDPSDRYVRQERVLNWGPTTVQYERIVMNDIKPPKIRAYAYPNPVKRGETMTVVYEVPRSAQGSIEVYDMRGKRLITLLDEYMHAGQGRVAWQGKNRFDRLLAPGTYLVVMRQDNDVSKWKLVIIP